MTPGFRKLDCTTESVHLQKLEQLLWKRLPDSVHILPLLRLVSEKRLPGEVDTQFFIFCDGDDDSVNVEDPENIFIVCIQRPNFYAKKGIIILPPRNVTTQHIETFDSFMDWNETQGFHSIHSSLSSVIEKLCKSHGNLVPKDQEWLSCVIYAITDIEKATNLDVKDLTSNNSNFVVRPLEQKDVPLVMERGKHWARSHSEKVVRNCIGVLPTAGVFENEEMASSVLMSPMGGFNSLYTSDKFRNRGLGQFVMRWITREFARQFGIIPIVEAEVLNEPSRRALLKAGYREMYFTKWYWYEPNA